MNLLARRVLDAAIEVHRHLGPGYAESVHENALAIELGLRGPSHQRQAGFRVDYKGNDVVEGRTDLLVERVLIVKLKAVDHLTEIHVAQAISYLKATGLPLALLINSDVPVLMRGVSWGIPSFFGVVCPLSVPVGARRWIREARTGGRDADPLRRSSFAQNGGSALAAPHRSPRGGAEPSGSGGLVPYCGLVLGGPHGSPAGRWAYVREERV